MSEGRGRGGRLGGRVEGRGVRHPNNVGHSILGGGVGWVRLLDCQHEVILTPSPVPHSLQGLHDCGEGTNHYCGDVGRGESQRNSNTVREEIMAHRNRHRERG